MTNVHGKCHHLNCQKYSEPLTFLQYNIFTLTYFMLSCV